MEDPPSDYNICPCCGTEFGYHDAGRTYEELRSVWLHSGANWWSPCDLPPRGWNAYQQLITAGMNVTMATEQSKISSGDASAYLQPERTLEFSYVNPPLTTANRMLPAA
jgi:hypothetical protein